MLTIVGRDGPNLRLSAVTWPLTRVDPSPYVQEQSQNPGLLVPHSGACAGKLRLSVSGNESVRIVPSCCCCLV